jgi:hypothetical protein
MPANRLPHEIDTDKLAEAAFAILSLTLHDERRVWKGLEDAPTSCAADPESLAIVEIGLDRSRRRE